MALHGKIIFRADGGPNLGMNHLVRCAALAEMLREHYECVLTIRSPNPTALQIIEGVFHSIIPLTVTDHFDGDELIPHLHEGDIVVMDGFQFHTAYQQKIHANNKLICIDDLHQHHFVADAIINHAEGILPADYSTEEYTRFYLGSRYAMIREPFINATPENHDSQKSNRAMICIGGNDIHNTTLKVLQSLIDTKTVNEIELVVGKLNPNLDLINEFIHSQKEMKIMLCMNLPVSELCDLMKTSRVMICSANNILLEACAAGMKIISGITHDAQQGVLQGLVAKGAVNSCGNFLTASPEELKSRFELFLNNDTHTVTQQTAQRELIDGLSPERLFEIFSKL